LGLCYLKCLVLPAVLNRADESKVVGAWRACGWRGAEVPDAHETSGKHVQQEAAQEFIETFSTEQMLSVICPVTGQLSLAPISVTRIAISSILRWTFLLRGALRAYPVPLK
jgi:hypothetical protein